MSRTNKKTNARSKKVAEEVEETTPLSDHEEETEAPVEQEVEEKQARARRPPPTSDSVTSEITKVINQISAEIDRLKESTEKTKGTKFLSKIRRQLNDVNKQVPRIKNTRSKKRPVKGNSGINKPKEISDELADFLKVDRGTLLSMADVTSAICTYIRVKDDEKDKDKIESRSRWIHLNPEGERNLQEPTSKKNINPDKKLSALLRYPAYKKDVSEGKVTTKSTGALVVDDRLNYCVLQKLIRVHFPPAVVVEKK
jgi:chromatin remodeling complex protein RSC6